MLNLNEWFYYDENAEYCLRSAKTLRSGKNLSKIEVNIGEEVGSVNSDGYVHVTWCGKRIKAHRVVWILLNGPIPEGYILDHINGIKTDNRISNLRLVTYKQNAQNKQLNSRGPITGVNFITFNRKGRNYGYWRVTYSKEGKKHFKDFSVLKLGMEKSMKEAIDYRIEKIKHLNESGEDYTFRHTRFIWEKEYD